MRRVVAFGLFAALGSCAPRPARPVADERAAADARPNVDGARELDQAGVRAFREGRYVDAIRAFRAALDLGGPSSELWNIARSREHVDDAEGAAAAIDEYLGHHDLSPQERAQAEREIQTLRSRQSMLTVTTTPSGAAVTLDGKQSLGPSPLSVEIPPGAHSLTIRHGGFAPETRTLQASFGRSVIVSLDLGRQHK